MIFKHKNLKAMIEYPKEGISSKVLSKTERKEVTLFSMAAGTEISEHTSTKEGMVYVIEGEGGFTLQGEKIRMEPGRIIFMEKNAPHSLEAEKNLSFLLVLVN
ncbi:MAG TPA: cupin domain-containing protein [Candidatus Nanoarchaeia archaeon]|nr:cupin domain-containing protein [Candidatus Nanoarchaeia archaeon]